MIIYNLLFREKAYDDLRSRYTKVQTDFIEKEYCF